MAMEAKPKSFLLPIFMSLFLILSLSAPTIIFPYKSPSLAACAGEPSASPTPIDPKQLRALQSLNIPISNEYDPCSNSSSSCDAASPFRHLLSLRLADCSDVQISNTALKSLSSLINFHLFNCPVAPVQFPTQLALNLRSFTCINSFRRLTGVWLSRLHNVTDLTVSGVYVNSSGPSIILANMKQIQSLTISQANLSGFLPKQWHFNITHIDFSGNKLRGKIPISITLLENLQHLNLSSNELVGELPDSIGNLMSLKNISLSSNYLSGTVPESMASIPTLVHLDLGSNQFNGTIPKFIAEMKELKYLNLEHNNFRGIMPFNESFIKRLEVLKIGGNDNLCYDRSTMPAKVKMAIAPCDKHGLPMSPPPPAEKRSSSADEMSSSENGDYSDIKNEDDQHRRSKVVFGVTIGITSMVFLIVFLNLLSKWCG